MKDYLLRKLVERQNEIVSWNRLSFHDLLKLSRLMDNNFLTHKCCIFNKNSSPSACMNFTMSTGTFSIRRVLYENYVGPTGDYQKLYATCGNHRCCNVKHLSLFKTMNRRYKYTPFIKPKKIVFETCKNSNLILDFN